MRRPDMYERYERRAWFFSKVFLVSFPLLAALILLHMSRVLSSTGDTVLMVIIGAIVSVSYLVSSVDATLMTAESFKELDRLKFGEDFLKDDV